MIISSKLEFCDDLVVTSTIASTNKVDLGATGTVLGGPAALVRDIGPGNPIPVMCQVTTAFTGAGTLVAEVRKADTWSMSGATIVARTAALGTAQLGTAGYQIPIALLPNDLDQRYIDVNFTVTGSFTAGAISAAIVAGVQTNLVPGR